MRDRPESSSGAAAAESWQRTLATEARYDAAVDVVGEATPVAVDVWIIDGAQDFQLLARVKVDEGSENSFKGVAIRASEVLRARLFEPAVDHREQLPSGAVPSPAVQAGEVESEGSQPSGRLGFELGAAALSSLDGVGPALLPLLRFDWAIESELVLQATLAGLGTRPNVATTAGEAEVAMQYGLLGACYRMDWHHRVRPLAALSFGALRTSVVGQAELPRVGHSVAQWSFLFDVSLGALFPLSQRYAVALAGHAQLAQPYVAVHFGDQRVASSGRPNLLVSLTFGAWP
ncbi:MAG TPA: hypothetical protein VFK05_31955 [Polyangiaceae bacterium]|nr:hypothetical protein [Polyangiaceae bacterium]